MISRPSSPQREHQQEERSHTARTNNFGVDEHSPEFVETYKLFCGWMSAKRTTRSYDRISIPSAFCGWLAAENKQLHSHHATTATFDSPPRVYELLFLNWLDDASNHPDVDQECKRDPHDWF